MKTMYNERVHKNDHGKEAPRLPEHRIRSAEAVGSGKTRCRRGLLIPLTLAILARIGADAAPAEGLPEG